MAYLKDFLPHVMMYIPSCPETVAIIALRDICMEFCAETQVWQETLDPVSSLVGVDQYDLSPPLNAAIQSVTSAWYKSIPIEVINSDSDAIIPEFYNKQFSGARLDKGDPAVLLVDINNKAMILRPIPQNSDPYAITVRAALKPTRTTTVVPDFLLNDYEYAISQGAIARITRMPGTDLYNLETAAAANMEYMREKGKAKIRANKTFSRSQVAVKMQRFGR